MSIKVFVVSMNCDNAAYEGDGCAEAVAANLHEIADKLCMGYTQGDVHDYNGNTVGKYFFADA